MLDKQNQLSYLVSRHMLALVGSFSKVRDSDLPAPQFFILQTLAKQDMLTSSYFANSMEVTLSAITNLSNKLVRKGYIERVVSETDRRQTYLKITEQGREVEQRMLERYRYLTDDLWSDFSDEELDLLIVSYEKMIVKMQSKSSEHTK